MRTLCLEKDAEEIIWIHAKLQKIKKLENVLRRGSPGEQKNAKFLIQKLRKKTFADFRAL